MSVPQRSNTYIYIYTCRQQGSDAMNDAINDAMNDGMNESFSAFTDLYEHVYMPTIRELMYG